MAAEHLAHLEAALGPERHDGEAWVRAERAQLEQLAGGNYWMGVKLWKVLQSSHEADAQVSVYEIEAACGCMAWFAAALAIESTRTVPSCISVSESAASNCTATLQAAHPPSAALTMESTAAETQAWIRCASGG